MFNPLLNGRSYIEKGLTYHRANHGTSPAAHLLANRACAKGGPSRVHRPWAYPQACMAAVDRADAAGSRVFRGAAGGLWCRQGPWY